MKLGESGAITVDQARIANNAVKLKVFQGIDPKASDRTSMTLAAFIEKEYLPDAFRRKRSVSDDEQKLKLRILPAFGIRPLGSIRTTDLMDFLNRLEDEAGLKPATLNRYRSAFQAIFRLAYALEFVDRNPAKALRKRPENTPPQRFLDAAELDAFVRAATDDENRQAGLFLLFLALTGARLGEALNAEVDDIDLVAATWRLPISKNGSADSIPLSAEALGVIGAVIGCRSTGPLFVGQRGNARMSRPSKAFERICKRARLEGCTIHMLRRTAASVAANAGVSLFDTSRLLRHRTISTTMGYLKLNPERLVEAHRILGACVLPAPHDMASRAY